MLQKFLTCLCLILGLAACTPTGPIAVDDAPASGSIANMRLFKQSYAPQGVDRSNQDIATEFLELAFELENGTKIDRFTRFTGPISIAFFQTPSVPASHDLDQLINRLRREALIDITRAPNKTHANINIEFVSKKAMNEYAPQAACFVIPNGKTWAHFKNTHAAVNHRWTHIPVRTQATVYIPIGAPPQEVRDCLHEEIMQALGPLNDLYRLSDSIFNDDNFHVAATNYDMLILRAFYSPQLRNGMSRSAVSSRILGILNGLNPIGAGRPPEGRPKTSKAWKKAAVSALGIGSSSSERKRFSGKMVELSLAENHNDARLGFSYYSRARVLERIRPDEAESLFNTAYSAFSATSGDTSAHRAHVAMKLARFAISNRDPERAIEWANSGLPAARAGQNAIAIFTLLSLKAKAYRLTGQKAQAAKFLSQAQGWGLYAYGSPQAVQNRLSRISRLGERY